MMKSVRHIRPNRKFLRSRVVKIAFIYPCFPSLPMCLIGFMGVIIPAKSGFVNGFSIIHINFIGLVFGNKLWEK